MDKECQLSEFKQIKLMLKSLPPQKLRLLKREEMLIHDSVQLNQLILGEKLANKITWQNLIAVKLKYMFSVSLAQNLLQEFNLVSTKLTKSEPLFAADKLMISLMKMIASWDVDIAVLIVDRAVMQHLPQHLKELLYIVLSEFKDLVEVRFLETEQD